MLDDSEFDRWLTAAREARAAAKLQVGAALYHWACFLAEQAAQLALKGLLHGIGAGAWGHDLVELGGRLEQSISASLPTEIATALQRLSRHYSPTRYPDAYPAGAPSAHYSKQDAEQALSDVDVIFDFVNSNWLQVKERALGD
jgi:HEPN domain-containing protein